MRLFQTLFFIQGRNVHRWTNKSVMTYQGWKNLNFGPRKNDFTVSKTHIRDIYKNIKFPHFSMYPTICSMKSGTCFSEEHSRPFSNAKNQFTTAVQPSVQKPCTMILLHNLAQIDWVSIGCTELVLSHVICFKSRTSEKNGNQSEHYKIQFQCKTPELLFESNCFDLLWTTSDSAELRCSAHENQPQRSIFHHILLSTTLESLSVMSPQNADSKQTLLIVLLKLTGDILVQKKSTAKEGFLACTHKASKLDHKYIKPDLLLTCGDTYISSAFICHKHLSIHCSVDTCSRFENLLGANKDFPDTKSCPAIYFMDTKGKCQSFLQQDLHSMKNEIANTFTCSNVTSIPTELENDLIPDCSDAEDESVLKEVLLGGSNHMCPSPNQLHCHLDHPRCYYVSDICIYKLNSYNVLTPCRTGSHLANCRVFQCHAHFKCSSSFCIPWRYIRDGKWDCMNGNDEVDTIKITCKKKFRCHESHVCLPVANICDNYSDCPASDDEILCELNGHFCPTECICINFAISCRKPLPSALVLPAPPYVVYHLTDCGLISVIDLMNKKVMVANFSHNSILDISTAFQCLHQLIAVDLSRNRITLIAELTFVSSPKLGCISLSHNEIVGIDQNSFINITFLHLLDLRHNNLTTVDSDIFNSVQMVLLLKLQDNALSEMHLTSNDDNIYLLFLDKFELCCSRPMLPGCIAPASWFSTCSDLLESKEQKIILPSLASILLAVNLIAFALISCQQDGKGPKPTIALRKNKPWKITVNTILGENVLHSAILFTLVATDSYFQNAFGLRQGLWRHSTPCAVSFALNIFHILLCPSQLAFLSHARLQVVLFPFESKFKSLKFVGKALMAMSLGVLLVSAAISIGLLPGTCLSKLCMPFVDHTGTNIGMKIFVTLVLGFELSVFLFILISSIFLLRGVKASQETFKRHSSVSLLVYIQLIILTLVPLLFWDSSSVVFLVLLYLPQYPLELPFYNGVLCRSLPGVILPVLFIVTIKRS